MDSNAPPVYLDYNATSPMRPEAAEVLRAHLDFPLNPSSIHVLGRRARSAVERAREQVAALLGADPAQVVFNGGATEGNNTLVHHILRTRGGDGRKGRIWVSAIEHPSVIQAAEKENIEQIPVRNSGVVDLDALSEKLSRGTPPDLISVMMVNNETGVIQPVADIAERAREFGVRVHTDAVQAAGRIPLDLSTLGVDYLTLSAHKLGGAQGVGALICGRCAEPPVLLNGGGQERRRRAGTENVAGIAAFGVAAELALKTRDSYAQLSVLRDDLENALACSAQTHGLSLRFAGQDSPRVAGTSAFCVRGVPSRTLLIHFDLSGICISDGSACASGTGQPSHVLAAMGFPPEDIAGALRVSMGWGTTHNDIKRFLESWDKLAARLAARATQGRTP